MLTNFFNYFQKAVFDILYKIGGLPFLSAYKVQIFVSY